MAEEQSTRQSQRLQRNKVLKEQRRRNPFWEARWAWGRIKGRAGNLYGNNPQYATVEVRMTRDEFLAWAIPAYTEWYRTHPAENPSIDRIESDKHYESGNLQLLTLSENSLKTKRLKNVYAPPGQAWCTIHKAYLPKDQFYKSDRQRYGVTTECRECVKLKTAQRHSLTFIKRGRRGRRSPRLITYLGKSQTVTQWSVEMNIGQQALFSRLNNGWDVERALTTPMRPKRKLA